jgi:DNA-binding transcriptional LysR family regulator
LQSRHEDDLMLDELRTFVAFADTGSMQRAAARVYRTPSAVTRHIQRLEQALGVDLLDRRSKPPVLSTSGRAVVEQSRRMLAALDDLRALGADGVEPVGAFRLGLAHALAEPNVAQPIRRFTARFPKLQLTCCSDTTGTLLQRVRSGDLDAALLILPAGSPLPTDVIGEVVAQERFVIVSPMAGAERRRQLADLDGRWVLNPKGCLVREALRTQLERAGASMEVVAEVHNLQLQLSLVAAGMGLGILPGRFVQQLSRRRQVQQVRVSDWDFRAAITFVHTGHARRLLAATKSLAGDLETHYHPT